MLRSGGRIAWRAPLYENLEACSLRDALIVSNPRVAKYPCRNRTILRSEKRVAGCDRRSSGRMVGKREAMRLLAKHRHHTNNAVVSVNACLQQLLPDCPSSIPQHERRRGASDRYEFKFFVYETMLVVRASRSDVASRPADNFFIRISWLAVRVRAKKSPGCGACWAGRSPHHPQRRPQEQVR